MNEEKKKLLKEAINRIKREKVIVEHEKKLEEDPNSPRNQHKLLIEDAKKHFDIR